MPRRRVKHVWIADDSRRRSTYNKRKMGMMKKISELSTLCGVNACAIIYSPDEQEPEVWPSHSEALNIITKFKSLPDAEQNKKMMDQEGFLGQMIDKLREQVTKQYKKNRECEMAQLMKESLGGKGLHEVGLEDLRDLGLWIEEKKKGIEKRIEVLRKEREEIDGTTRDEGNEMPMTVEAMRNQPWFMEVMSPYEGMFGVNETEMIPYGDDVVWSFGDLFS